jgi:hypothetical protein
MGRACVKGCVAVGRACVKGCVAVGASYFRGSRCGCKLTACSLLRMCLHGCMCLHVRERCKLNSVHGLHGLKRTNRERRVPELGLLVQYALQWRKVLRGQPTTRCDAGASGPHEGSHRNGDPGHGELQLKLQCTTTALPRSAPVPQVSTSPRSQKAAKALDVCHVTPACDRNGKEQVSLLEGCPDRRRSKAACQRHVSACADFEGFGSWNRK